MRLACTSSLLSLLVTLAVAPPARAFDPGRDGALNVDEPDQVLNRYAALAVDAEAGDGQLVVDDVARLAVDEEHPLAAGDVLLVIQMQGAQIAGTDDAEYGAVESLGGAGRYELVSVGEIEGDVIALGDGCEAGLRNGYEAAAGAQVVRVPQFTELEVGEEGSVTGLPWDGETGGVVALIARDRVVLDGEIDATGLGFRGGRTDDASSSSGADVTTFVSTSQNAGGEKGEGIAGAGDDYQEGAGAYGRGAPANGGGGGTSHNAGGGGGANGDDGEPWTGQGVMDADAEGAGAWALDPVVVAAEGALADSSGGGRGGYSFSSVDEDALTVAPGDASWGGNSRRDRGGWGGRPLELDPAERLALGGGGGAGDGNNGGAGGGGAGGGLVLLITPSLQGSGDVAADGAVGSDTSNDQGRDGAGGGGGGGTVVIFGSAAPSVTLSARGGDGGYQFIDSEAFGDEGEGPGGGGGGGVVVTAAGAASLDVGGGAAGLTDSLGVTEFPKNGATGGASGRALPEARTIYGLPFCGGDDLDGDGLSNGDEGDEGSDPFDPDSDDDGLTDGEEVHDYETDPTDPDSDDDGLTDGQEVNDYETDPNDPDSDDDGLTDGQEVNDYETDPNNPDSDDDGLLDGAEVSFNTDPNDPDTDDDTLCDGSGGSGSAACRGGEDLDGDGQLDDGETDPRDPDTDDGGIDDGTEVFDQGTDPRDPLDDFTGGGDAGGGDAGADAGGAGDLGGSDAGAAGNLRFQGGSALDCGSCASQAPGRGRANGLLWALLVGGLLLRRRARRT